jgi:hypothetical protein
MPPFETASARLQQQGWVRLVGTETGHSRGVRSLLMVVMWLIPAVMVMILIALFVLWILGVEIPSQIFLAAGFAILLLGIVMLIPGIALRSMNRARTSEAFDVVLAPNGLTLRGVGPIPWTHFAPAQMKLVMSEHGGGGYKRRAVMPLTEAGIATVNGALAPELRERLFYATGPAWDRLTRYIAVPGIQGMNTKESMALLNQGQYLFLSGPRH